MAAARVRAPAPIEDVPPELSEVPAAVVCAVCGMSDCAGCTLEPDAKTASGVVVFVPWERRGSRWSRLWATTRASTDGAGPFFSSMPDGPLAPALSFAVLAEAIAVGSSVAAFVALGIGLAFATFPEAAMIVLRDGIFRVRAAHAVLAAWAAFVVVLVGAHALHGATLDLFARREGARGSLRRALRFGLYAAGWDVATSPFGLLVAFLASGVASLGEARTYAFRTPGRSTAALLRGVYALDGERAKRVRVRSMTGTMIASTLAIIGAFVVTFLAGR